MYSLFKNYPKYLTFGLVTMFFSSFGQTFFLSFFNLGIEKSLNISSNELAKIYGVATLLSGVGLPWFGRKLDITSTKLYSIMVAMVVFFAFMMLAFAQNTAILLFSLVLIRLFGQSLLPMSAMTFMTRHFGRFRGRALSISSFGRSIAEGFLPVFVGFLLLRFDFRFSVMILAGLLLFIYIPTVLLTLSSQDPTEPFFTDKDHASNKPVFANSDLNSLLRDYRFWILSLCNIVLPFCLTGIFFLHHAFGRELEWTTSDWAAGFIFYSLAQTSFNLMGGFLIDTFSARKVMPFILIPFSLGLIFLLGFNQVLPGKLLVFYALCFFGASVGMVGNVKSSFFAEKYGLGSLGAIKSVDATIIVVATAAAPVFMNTFMNSFGVISLINVLLFISLSGVIGHSFISLEASGKLRRRSAHTQY
jgi:MFS family permease